MSEFHRRTGRYESQPRRRYTFVFYAALVVALISTYGVYRVLEATRTATALGVPAVTSPELLARVDSLDRRLRQMQLDRDRFLDSVSARLGAADSSTVAVAALAAQVRRLNARVDTATQQTLALRQAITPTHPDEVLTVARLRDQVVGIQSRLEDVRSSTRTDQETFRAFVLRELDTTRELTRVIMGAVFAQALAMLYTAWRERKGTPTVEAKVDDK
jgi:hypothetical protein